MASDIENWKTQIKKGYLELCLLLLIRAKKRLYGFELLEILEKASLPVKEGTLYPMLNRMTQEGMLAAAWETDNLKGHPRKFYSLTREGSRLLDDMRSEFGRMTDILEKLEK